ncbi:MAG: hypothetical protein IJY12_01435 [Clostridia bacterium]|nr:hypothetical protein [Clostridia bacterium]
MKKAVILALLCLFLASCGNETEEPLIGPPGALAPEDTTPCAITTPMPTTPAITSSWNEVPPLTNQVELLDGEGCALETYSEMIWLMDGILVGDGYLMFQSVPDRLSAIDDQIPLVNLNGVPTVRVMVGETETARGGDTVSVYGEDYAELANRVSWAEVLSRGEDEWSGRTVYLYFTVNYSSTYSADYTKEISTAYFVKTTFR